MTQQSQENAALNTLGLGALTAGGSLPLAADHIGVAVYDVDEAAARYGQMFGITTWRRIRFSAVAQYRGSVHRITGIAATGSLGTIGLEVVAPDEGRWTASDVLTERGESAYHAGFRVSDLPRALDECRAAGMTPTLIGTADNGIPAFSYIESSQATAVLIELVAEKLPPSFLTEVTTRAVG